MDFPGFWCNPCNRFAIHRGFAILSQSNLIVSIAVRIGVLRFSADFFPVPVRFLFDCDTEAIPDRLMAFGCDPSKLCQDCIKSAIDPQSTGLCQDCKEPENPVSGIARLREDREASRGLRRTPGQPDDSNRNPGAIGVGTNPVQSKRNPFELSQDYPKSPIQSQSSGLQISRSRLREDCDNPKELFSGIAGHREDCRGSPSNCLGLPSSLGSDLTDSR